MIDEYKLAYIAGYTDGDGCFHIRKQVRQSTGTSKYFCSFIISSTDKEVIRFLFETFPCIRRLADNREKYKVQKPQYHFIMRGKKSINLIQSIIPFLVEKREEAETYIRFINSSTKEEKEKWMNRLKEIKNECNLIKKSHKEWLGQFKLTKIPTELDFAYLAGFIDAECCLGISRYTDKKRPNFIYKMLLQCGNTKLPIFLWLMERFAGQIHFIERQSKNPNHRDVLMWHLSSKSLSQILPKIFPFLKHKQPVCAELIRFYETTIPLIGTISRNSPNFREFYAPVLEERDRIFHKIHHLNQRGIQNT